jgi:hypothetical protein
MAENKKSFILYADQKGLFAKLPDELAGKLIKHIFSYVNDEDPKVDDLLLDIAFEPIKLQLKRDLKNWEETKENKSLSGRLGNLKRWNLDLYNEYLAEKITLDQAENIAKHRTRSQPIANIAVNDTVNVNVNDTVNVNDKTIAERFPPSSKGKEPNGKSAGIKEVKTIAYKQCVDVWLKEIKIGWSFTAIHGKKIKSIIAKIEKTLKDAGTETTEETITNFFRVMCQNLPTWYQDKDLAIIDASYNTIITEIKNKNNGQTITRQPAISKYHN